MVEITILDGGMGQELIARAPEEATPLWSTKVMMDHPEIVRAIHDDYFAAGADVATTNTYAVLRDRLKQYDLNHRFEELQERACTLAADARDANGGGQIAGSLGPLGWSYRPDMAPPAAEAAKLYAEIAELQKPFVDIFICETMSGIDQARGALMGLAEAGKPVWVAMSVDDDDGTKLRSGEPVADVIELAQEYKPDAVLLNCSIPEAVSQAMPILAGHGLTLGAYANGFTKITNGFASGKTTVDLLTARTDLGPDAYADFAQSWVDMGATIIGGCCEVGPAHIAELVRRFK